MACYLIEQGKYKHYQGTQIFALRHPDSFRELMKRLVDITSDYLLMQIEAGAEVLQLFDSWAGILSEEDYRRFALEPLAEILSRIGERVPTIVYASGTSHLAAALVESGTKGISCDAKTPLRDISSKVPDSVLLQGNLDPTHLYGSSEQVRRETEGMLREGNAHGRYIANLGHGILLDTPVENARTFIDTVLNSSARNSSAHNSSGPS